MASTAKQISERIDALPAGSVFIPADFIDIASVSNANTTLSRMAEQGSITRAIRGVYYKPRYNKLLDKEIPASPDDVAKAIARNNKWIISPSGNHALNQLGLDTQVPATYEYVSSGPYKTYNINGFTVEMKHRANRDLLECSPLTCLIIQALRALGKSRATDEVANQLVHRLSQEQLDTFYDETRNSAAWIFEFAKKMREIKNAQHSDS